MGNVKKPRTEAQLENDRKIAEYPKSRAIFKTPDELLEKFEEYLKAEESTFGTKPPSISRFADWLGEKRYTMFDYIVKWPKAENVIRSMFADILVEHAIVGEYRDAVSIFTLKNRCNWVDKKETIATNRNVDIATPDEARTNMRRIKESLGFDDHGRAGKLAKKNISDLECRVIQLAEAKSEGQEEKDIENAD